MHPLIIAVLHNTVFSGAKARYVLGNIYEEQFRRLAPETRDKPEVPPALLALTAVAVSFLG